jgi:ribosomal protein L4
VKCVATLTGAPVVSKDTGTVTISALNGCVNQPLAKVPGYSDLKANDVVLWYKDSLGVYNVEKAASVSGSVAKYVPAPITPSPRSPSAGRPTCTPACRHGRPCRGRRNNRDERRLLL